MDALVSLLHGVGFANYTSYVIEYKTPPKWYYLLKYIYSWLNKVILTDWVLIKQLQRASTSKCQWLHWSCMAPSNISSCDSSCHSASEILSYTLPSDSHRSFYQLNQALFNSQTTCSHCCSSHCRSDSLISVINRFFKTLEGHPTCICCCKLMRSDCCWQCLILCSIGRCFWGFNLEAHLECSKHRLFCFHKEEVDCSLIKEEWFSNFQCCSYILHQPSDLSVKSYFSLGQQAYITLPLNPAHMTH